MAPAIRVPWGLPSPPIHEGDGPTVDAIDEKIIAELTRNGRISHSELAGKVLLSRNAVRQRIERLERQGHIAGYTIVRAGDDTGDVVSALVLVYRQDRMRGGDVLAALKRIPEVVICEILSGDFDIMVRLEAASLERVRVIWEDIAQMPGVRDTVTALTLSSVVNRPRGERRHGSGVSRRWPSSPSGSRPGPRGPPRPPRWPGPLRDPGGRRIAMCGGQGGHRAHRPDGLAGRQQCHVPLVAQVDRWVERTAGPVGTGTGPFRITKLTGKSKARSTVTTATGAAGPRRPASTSPGSATVPPAPTPCTASTSPSGSPPPR